MLANLAICPVQLSNAFNSCDVDDSGFLGYDQIVKLCYMLDIPASPQNVMKFLTEGATHKKVGISTQLSV